MFDELAVRYGVVLGKRIGKWLIIILTAATLVLLLNRARSNLLNKGPDESVDPAAVREAVELLHALWNQGNATNDFLEDILEDAPHSQKRPKSSRMNLTNAALWANPPRLTILIRMYHASVVEYWQIFAPSYLIFWPRDKWKNSDLVLVFDEESAQDHQASTTLSLLPPYPKIVFEKAPPPGTLCSTWRREGYSRQMYSNFYADLQTDAAYIGIADTDSFFSTKVVIEDLFENGKPRILGYNAVLYGWEKTASKIVNGQTFGEFMTVLGFPFIVKREHFKLFREHVVSVNNGDTFEECFHNICSAHKNYSQFDFLAYYMFAHHRDEYSWHIRDQLETNHPALTTGRMTNDPEVLARSSGKMGVMKHAHGHGNYSDFPFVIYDYICTAADHSPKVGSCDREPAKYRHAIRKSVEYNQLTDWLVPTAYWIERKFPFSIMLLPLFPFAGERIPKNSRSLLDEHYELVELYNGSWHW